MNQTTHKMTDPIQIKHYKEDITSFNQLYKEFQRRFVRFANTYVRDLTTAEDITIEAMMYYWENRQSLSEDSNIPAYILTIIKNKCLNYLRHQQIHEEYSDKIKDYYEWELNTRIATLQACEPYEHFYFRNSRTRPTNPHRHARKNPYYLHVEPIRKQIL